ATARQIVQPPEAPEEPEAEEHGQLAGRRDEAEAEPRARVRLGAMVALLVVDVTEIGRHERVERPQVQQITRDSHAVLEKERGEDQCRRGVHQEPATARRAAGSDTASRRARNASATSGALPDTTSAARAPSGWAMAPSSRLPNGAMPMNMTVCRPITRPR